MSLQTFPTPKVVVHGWRPALLPKLVLVMDVPFLGGKNAPVLEEERLHNTLELLFIDSLPPVPPFPVEYRPCQVSCSSPCLSISWFVDPSDVHQLLGAD